VFLSFAWAEEAKTSEEPVVLGPGLTVDIHKREVLMEATVCLRYGTLEFITCRPGGRKSYQHESIFSSSVTPSLVHAGLLFIGLEPQRVKSGEALEAIPIGKPSRLLVGVEFEREGKLLRQPLSDWMTNCEKPTAPVPNLWIFTGSTFFEEKGHSQYAADVLGHTIGLTSRGFGVIQFGELVSGDHNPQRGLNHDKGMKLLTHLVPEVGTKVRLIFSPSSEKSTKTKEMPIPGAAAPGLDKP
jgi:hypothetical protein